MRISLLLLLVVVCSVLASSAAAEEICDFDSIEGQEVVFEPISERSRERGYRWTKEPEIIGDRYAHDELVGKRGVLLDELFEVGKNDLFYKIIVEDCRVAYLWRSGSEPTQDALASTNVAFVLPDDLDALVEHPMPTTLEEEGACLERRLSASSEGFPTEFSICFVVGQPKSLDDDRIPRVVIWLRSVEWQANTSDWQVTIKKDGQEIFSGRPSGSRPSVVDCRRSGCIYSSLAFVLEGREFSPGSYDFNFIFAHDTDLDFDFRLRLVEEEEPVEESVDQAVEEDAVEENVEEVEASPEGEGGEDEGEEKEVKKDVDSESAERGNEEP